MKKSNVIARILWVIGIVQIIAGFVSGFWMGKSSIGIILGYSEFSLFNFLFWVFSGIFSGMLFIALGEGVRLLGVIANHAKSVDFNTKRVKDKYFESE